MDGYLYIKNVITYFSIQRFVIVSFAVPVHYFLLLFNLDHFPCLLPCYFQYIYMWYQHIYLQRHKHSLTHGCYDVKF